MSNFDGKHWGGRRSPNGHYKINGNAFLRQARRNLGAGGIVAVPNARGENHPLGAEYRYEELRRMLGNFVATINDRRAFYSPEKDIYVIKAQEVNANLKGENVPILVYNLLFEHNLKESKGISVKKCLDEALEKDCIIGMTAPSCSQQGLEYLSKENKDLLGFFDFVITYSGSALKTANKRAKAFYDNFVRDKEFESPLNEIHKIGSIAVSGGHRTPSVGSSYSNIKMPDIWGAKRDFFRELKEGLRTSPKGFGNKERGILFDTSKHMLAMLKDRIFGYK